MALFYKQFRVLRTVLCALVLTFAVPAQADEALFTVEGIEVDVTAESAAQARKQAFDEAQMAAFTELSSRILTADEIEYLVPPDLYLVSSLINDFEVTSEKLSRVRYIGTYTFRFKEEEVQNFFATQGLRYTSEASQPVLILPFFEKGQEMQLWSPYNPWLAAWQRTDVARGLLPIEVPIGDLADVSDIDNVQYRQNNLEAMLRRYGAGEAVMAIARPDDAQAPGLLIVDLYRTDREGPEPVQRLTVNREEGEMLEAFYMRATMEVHQTLQQNWKNRTVVNQVTGDRLPVRVTFSGLPEWAATQRALKNVSAIEEVVIKSMSPRQAELELVFQGSQKNLRVDLARAGLSLNIPSFDPYSLSAGHNTTAFMYELQVNTPPGAVPGGQL